MQAVFKKFGKDEQGAVAMTFGLALTALLFMCGMAMDYARTMNARSRVADAADSAALVAGRALMEGKLSVAEMEKMAAKYFEQNIKGLGTTANVDRPSIKIDPKTGAVTVDVNAHVPMTLTKILGFKTLDFPVTTTAMFKQRDIEVGMALDITGSMGNNDDAGQPKIKGLKQAFEKFADRLLPDGRNSEQKVRIAVAPYSASVNLGDFAKSASANRSTDKCVTESKTGSGSDAQDTFLVSADGVKDVDPTEGNVGKAAYFCPAPSVMPLTDDREALVATVKKFTTNGWTGGHMGVQWAWNLISDNWSWDGAKGEGYDKVADGKLLKAVVLMTDGIFNTAYHGKKSSQQAIALCDAMKAKGVIVFSVAFDTKKEPADAATLKACATPGVGYYANASNAAELEKAFENFASQLTELRLTK